MNAIKEQEETDLNFNPIIRIYYQPLLRIYVAGNSVPVAVTSHTTTRRCVEQYLGRAQLGLSETNPRINSGTQYFNPRTATRMDGAVQLEIRRIVVSTGIQRESSTPSSSLIRSIECKWHRNSPFNCRQLAVATPFFSNTRGLYSFGTTTCRQCRIKRLGLFCIQMPFKSIKRISESLNCVAVNGRMQELTLFVLNCREVYTGKKGLEGGS